jgi:CTP synthase
VDPATKYPIIDTLPEQVELMKQKNFGGSMRLGGFSCRLKPNTLAYAAYKQNLISERHRHRYEVNNDFKETLESHGMIFSGINPEKNLAEIAELKDHPFFVGTQFHPEFKSRPLTPHPLFLKFIEACARPRKSTSKKFTRPNF